MAQLSWRHFVLALSLALASGTGLERASAQERSVQRTDTAVAGFASLDELLEAIDAADEQIDALTAQISYDRRFLLQGDKQIREGSLAYRSTPPAESEQAPTRAFAVTFDRLIVGDQARDQKQQFAFDGRWLIERDYDSKQFIRRELAPAGRTIDATRLGHGPIPLPIGQRKADILARFDAEMLPADAGFDTSDPTQEAYAAAVRDAVQLKLTPKPEATQVAEQFRQIRLWYHRPEGGGPLLPRLAKAVDRKGDEIYVLLFDVRLRDELPEHLIDMTPPARGEGWDVQEERGRWDDEAAPAPTTATPEPVDSSHAIDGAPLPIVLARQDSRELRQAGEDTPPMEAPEPAEQVLRAIELGYLSYDERADTRVFHGLWTSDDLDDPTRRARAALMLGVWDDEAFDDESVPVELRAEAMVARGALREALEVLRGVDSIRATRLRGEALEGLARFDDAATELATLERDFRAGAFQTAPELTDAAIAMTTLARLRGESSDYFQEIIQALTTAHQRLDRLYWPAILAEAELLEDKGNYQQALEAAQQVLTLNQASAGAWAIVGRRMVASFSLDRAEAVASRLTSLARRVDRDRPMSAMGRLISARARLRLNDPELADEYVLEILRRYPKHREALALRAGVEATRYDWGGVETAVAAYDELSPGSPRALFEAGAAASERRQYGHAAELLERAIERQPNWPEPVVELGLLEIQSGRDVRARDALLRAVELDPFHVRAANSLKLVEGLMTEFTTLETEHFIVRYQPGVDEVMAREMAGDLERMHAIVCEAMGHEPSQKTMVELMPDHEWFAVRVVGMPSIWTVAAATGPVIAMEAPKVGKRHTGLYNWERVARHEYAHTVTLSRTDNRIPLWFTEAAAVAMELAPRDWNTIQLLSNALKNNWLFSLDEINLGFIRPKRDFDRPLAYAQAHWTWEFIQQTWSEEATLEMMDRFAQGQRVPRVLDEMFGLSPEAFMERFEAWAVQDVRSWGMLPEPSIDELRLEETLADPVLAEGVAEALALAARRTAAAVHAGVEEPELPEVRLIREGPDDIEFWSELYPNQPEVLRRLIGQQLEESFDVITPRIEELLERYAEARPVDPFPHRLLARHNLASDDPASAIPHLEFLDEREVYSTAYAAALARRYAEVGRYDRALSKAERAVRIAPFDGDYRELAATVAIQQRDFDAAERHIEALTKLEPDVELHRKRLERLRELRASGG